jgi:small subunit ribosomal protein S16
MAVKLRLARHGRKRYAYFHIIAADARSPRDGRLIERIGTYNPNTNPATIELDFERALTWLKNGAQPTETVRRILSYKGVLMMKHLHDGVKKGAFDEAEAEKRFKEWLIEKSAKISTKIETLSKEQQDIENARLDAESKVNQERAQAIAKKYAEEAKLIDKESETVEDESEETETVETPENSVEEKTEETAAEEKVEEPVVEEKTEEAVEEEKLEEPVVEEKTEEAVEEEKLEEPIVEEKTEEAVKEETKKEE